METLKALKSCIKGITTKEVVTEYAVDEETGKLKVVKQKVSEKTIPPNVAYPTLTLTGCNATPSIPSANALGNTFFKI